MSCALSSPPSTREGIRIYPCNHYLQKYSNDTYSLKAEHGTGRNVAPYVEMEWGKDGYKLMKSIKKLFDPDYLLNPGKSTVNDT